MPPLLADFIYSSDCKLICEKSLTLPEEFFHSELFKDLEQELK